MAGRSPTLNKDTFEYDSFGWLTKQTRLIDGRSYALETTGFDVLNRPLMVKYPTNEVVTLTYDREGENTLKAGSNDLVTDVTYNVRGQMLKLDRAGSAVDTTYVYYNATGSSGTGNSNFRLQKMTHGSDADVWPNMEYTYDQVGNIKTLNTTASGVAADNQLFDYDDLNRLTSACTVASGTTCGSSGPAPYTVTYTYNEIGNILTFEGSSYNYNNVGWNGNCDTPTPSQAMPHAVRKIGSHYFCYDANGNMTERFDGTTTTLQNFDAENRLVRVIGAGLSTTDFAYDASGQRVKTVEPGEKRLFSHPPRRPSSKTAVFQPQMNTDKHRFLSAFVRVCPRLIENVGEKRPFAPHSFRRRSSVVRRRKRPFSGHGKTRKDTENGRFPTHSVVRRRSSETAVFPTHSVVSRQLSVVGNGRFYPQMNTNTPRFLSTFVRVRPRPIEKVGEKRPLSPHSVVGRRSSVVGNGRFQPPMNINNPKFCPRLSVFVRVLLRKLGRNGRFHTHSVIRRQWSVVRNGRFPTTNATNKHKFLSSFVRVRPRPIKNVGEKRPFSHPFRRQLLVVKNGRFPFPPSSVVGCRWLATAVSPFPPLLVAGCWLLETAVFPFARRWSSVVRNGRFLDTEKHGRTRKTAVFPPFRRRSSVVKNAPPSALFPNCDFLPRSVFQLMWTKQIGAIFSTAPSSNEKRSWKMGIIMWLIVGGVAGWLAGQILKGGGFGLIGNIVIGIIGGVVGGWLFGVLGLSAAGVIGEIITAVVGAVVLLYVIGLIRK